VVLGAIELASRAHLPVPSTPDEVRSARLWWTYRNTKAKRELGFSPRPHEETLEEAVRWEMDRLDGRIASSPGPERAALGALGRAMRLGERVAGR
jgi:hypothetical protein